MRAFIAFHPKINQFIRKPWFPFVLSLFSVFCFVTSIHLRLMLHLLLFFLIEAIYCIIHMWHIKFQISILWETKNNQTQIVSPSYWQCWMAAVETRRMAKTKEETTRKAIIYWMQWVGGRERRMIFITIEHSTPSQNCYPKNTRNVQIEHRKRFRNHSCHFTWCHYALANTDLRSLCVWANKFNSIKLLEL